jgi:hypothetical protein
MSYLFIKICFKEKSLYYFLQKLKKKKKKKINIFSGFFRWFFLGYFGWVFYCQPCKQVGFVDGPRGGHIAKRRQRGAVGFSNAAVTSLLPDDDVVFDTEKRSEQAGRGRPIYGAGGGRKNWRPIQRRGGPGRTPPGIHLLCSTVFFSKLDFRVIYFCKTVHSFSF